MIEEETTPLLQEFEQPRKDSDMNKYLEESLKTNTYQKKVSNPNNEKTSNRIFEQLKKIVGLSNEGYVKLQEENIASDGSSKQIVDEQNSSQESTIDDEKEKEMQLEI